MTSFFELVDYREMQWVRTHRTQIMMLPSDSNLPVIRLESCTVWNWFETETCVIGGCNRINVLNNVKERCVVVLNKSNCLRSSMMSYQDSDETISKETLINLPEDEFALVFLTQSNVKGWIRTSENMFFHTYNTNFGGNWFASRTYQNEIYTELLDLDGYHLFRSNSSVFVVRASLESKQPITLDSGVLLEPWKLVVETYQEEAGSS